MSYYNANVSISTICARRWHVHVSIKKGASVLGPRRLCTLSMIDTVGCIMAITITTNPILQLDGFNKTAQIKNDISAYVGGVWGMCTAQFTCSIPSVVLTALSASSPMFQNLQFLWCVHLPSSTFTVTIFPKCRGNETLPCDISANRPKT